MTKYKKEAVAKILGYMPYDEQLKQLEQLFTPKLIQDIIDYPVDEMLGIQDTLFIKELKEKAEGL